MIDQHGNLAYVSLGSNQSDREVSLGTAIGKMELLGTITARSSIYETAPWGNEDQTSFLNQVIGLKTALTPQELIASLLKIESEMGRQRLKKWEPRIIDLDILLFGNVYIRTPDLVIPHPHLHERRFVLVPLAEIARQAIHPGFQKNITELLEVCEDTGEVNKLT